MASDLRSDVPRAAARNRRALILILAILSLAAALRFYRIGAKSLWLDEVMSVRLARMSSVCEVVREVSSYDVHPPLYPIAHFLWMRLGDGDGLARVPSAVFGIVTAAMLYLLARRLLGGASALTAALLMAVSSFNVYYSQEARNYSMIVMLTVTMSWLLVVIIQSGDDVKWWAWTAYGLVATACLYTFVMSILVIASHWLIFLLLARKTRRNLICGVGVQCCVGLAFLPWLPWLMRSQRTIEAIAGAQHSVPAPGLTDVLTAFGQWSFAPDFVMGSSAGGIEQVWGALVIAIILFAFICRRREPAAVVVMASLILVPIIAFIALPMTRVHRFDPKHLIFIQPICMLAIAAVASPGARLPRLLRPMATVLPIIVIAANLALLGLYFDRGREKECWPEAAEFVSSEPNAEVLLVNPGRGTPYAFARYYRGPGRVIGIDAPDARIPARFGAVWLVSCWNEALSPTPGLIEWFNRNMTPVHGRFFRGAPGRRIRCALYASPSSAGATSEPATVPH